jgi:quercetin dioxygenase-like cupin family protein
MTTTLPGLTVVHAADTNAVPAFEGLTRRVLAYNERLMLVEHTMEAGSVFPRHNHPHDQLAYLIAGHIRVQCGDDTFFEARAGDSFVLRGGIDHQVVALARSVALDVFTPVREDYLPAAGA